MDDAGALAVLHALANQGHCQILAVGVSTSVQAEEGHAAALCVEVLNQFYGRPEIPIGISCSPYVIEHRRGKYVQAVADAFSHSSRSPEDWPEAWRLYRQVLATQADGSVTMVSIGFLNNLQDLLQSPADEDSPLTGQELVAAKVKEWVCMGGYYPQGQEEFNFNTYALATQAVLAQWPTPAAFVGSEFGREIKTGAVLLQHYTADRHPLALCWQQYNGGRDRSSWDQIAVLYAVMGCHSWFRRSVPGWNQLVITGAYIPNVLYKSKNRWRLSDRWFHRWLNRRSARHVYLRPTVSDQQLANAIDRLMLQAGE